MALDSNSLHCAFKGLHSQLQKSLPNEIVIVISELRASVEVKETLNLFSGAFDAARGHKLPELSPPDRVILMPTLGRLSFNHNESSGLP